MAERKRLLIVGAGAFARGLLGYIRALPGWMREFEPVGFLDRNRDALKHFPCDLPIIGDDDSYEIGQRDVFACGLTAPALKLRVCGNLEKRGAKFVTIIHPTAVIGPHCDIGEGSVICPNAVLTTNVKVGKFVTVHLGSGIGHDSVLGNGVTLNPGVQIGGKTTLEEGAFCGSMSAVLEQSTVGRYARIGSRSAAISHICDGWTVMGVPARRIQFNEEVHPEGS